MKTAENLNRIEQAIKKYFSNCYEAEENIISFDNDRILLAYTFYRDEEEVFIQATLNIKSLYALVKIMDDGIQIYQEKISFTNYTELAEWMKKTTYDDFVDIYYREVGAKFL